MANPKRFSTGFASAGSVAAGAAYAEMMAGAARSATLRALTATLLSAGGGGVTLVRSFRVGTGTTVQTAVCHQLVGTGSVASGTFTSNTPPSGSAQVFSAWSQAPTGLTHALRRAPFGAGTGATIELWKEDYGPLAVEPGQSLLVVNSGSGIDGPGICLNFTWEETPL